MGRLTTHVLDIARGVPARGVAIVLTDADGVVLGRFVTNAGGRVDGPLLAAEAFSTGVYTLTFHVAAYFARFAGPVAAGPVAAGPPFLDEIPVRFGVSDPAAHYHVPLLVSPWSFSTYRGS